MVENKEEQIFIKDSEPVAEKVFSPIRSKEEQEKKLHAFESDLSKLINSHSLENMSDTPDFILANYLTNCLRVFNESTKKRNKLYSK